MATGSSVAVQVDDLPGGGDRPRLHPVARRRSRSRTKGRPLRSSKLSAKEVLVLRELAQGHTTEQIGEILIVSPHTVRTHIKNGMRKLGARTRAHAVAIAMSDGAIKLDA
jgi:DNA-binding CsgD family transcriptional regulator